MQRWRHLWRPLTAIGSALLTLSMLLSLALGLAPSLLDNWLTTVGVSDWQVNIEQISTERVVIDKLQLTYQSPQILQSDNPSGEDTASVTLDHILSYSLPSWLPPQLVIKQLDLTLNTNEGMQRIVADLDINTRKPAITISLQSPYQGSFALSRQQDQRIRAQLHHHAMNAEVNYDTDSGGFDLAADALLPQSSVSAWSGGYITETVSLSATAEGHFSSSVTLADPQNLLRQLSANARMRFTAPLSIQHNMGAALASGDAYVSIHDGVLNNYQLNLSGQVTPRRDTQISVGDVNWHVHSADRLALDLTTPEQVLDKTRWPLTVTLDVGENSPAIQQLMVKLTGNINQRMGKFLAVNFPDTELRYERLELPSLSLIDGQFSGNSHFDGQRISVNSNNAFSSILVNNDVSFNADIGGFSAVIDSDDISRSNLDVLLYLSNFKSSKRVFDEYVDISDLGIRQQITYTDQQAVIDGTIQLDQDVIVRHNTQINADAKLSSTLSTEVNNLASKSVQRRFKPLMTAYAPLLTLSSGTLSAQASLQANLNTREWKFDDGRLDINNLSGIYDTLAIADTDITTRFVLTPDNLSLTETKLDIASIQQGFSIGPLNANFAAQIPLDNTAASQLILQQHRFNAFGGRITVPNQPYQFNQDLFIPIVFEQLNLGELMRQYPTDKIAIDGEVSGTIPLRWNSEQLTVERGYVNAVAPGGQLQVDSSALRSAVGGNPSLQTLASVLENFYYQELSSVIDYDKNGDLTLGLQLTGYNPAVENGRTVKLNITLQEDLPALIRGLQLSNSVSDVIRKRIQQRVN